MKRSAGILLPISSLPSKYGIGCFDKAAYAFVDFLKDAGQNCWQILPLGQTSYGDSPYQSFSTFAGNPYFISLDALCDEQLLTKEECEAVLKAQEKSGCKALICHVLRYAPAFLKVAELIDSGAIGRLVAIDALERVTYWHQAHSYVRGNWRTTKETAPMILAKCCHDLDLIQYYAKSKCKSVSSVGELTFFNKANQPEGAADRCLQCKYVETCPYSAKEKSVLARRLLAVQRSCFRTRHRRKTDERSA